ncbi:TPA: hypothetical protein DCW61_03710 [Candidatus Uhrbacteria bacterium]|nr:hypothetical protein [Candidatus Uhrbacteria bacterium]
MPKKFLVLLMCLCLFLFSGNRTISAEETSEENPSTLSEAKAQYRQRIRKKLSAREERARGPLGDLPGSRILDGQCLTAKQSYRKAERGYAEIEAALANENGDETYKQDLQRLKKQTADALLLARQTALMTGSQMTKRAEMETQLASIQKEREDFEAKWRKEDEPPQAYAMGRWPPAYRAYQETGDAEPHRVGWGGSYGRGSGIESPPPKLPWEFSVCFPAESEKRDERVNELTNAVPKPIIKVVYFAAKGTNPDLTVIRNRMNQAKKWFQSRDIGTFEFRVSMVYAQKNRSFYQANVWDKVNTELGLTCNSGISLVIVDHPPLLKEDALGLGMHCGTDYSSGWNGHAMIAYEQLRGKDGLNTLIHEMGHALSLPQGDDSVPNAIMNPYCGINPATAVLLRRERIALKNSPYFSER